MHQTSATLEFWLGWQSYENAISAVKNSVHGAHVGCQSQICTFDPICSRRPTAVVTLLIILTSFVFSKESSVLWYVNLANLILDEDICQNLFFSNGAFLNDTQEIRRPPPGVRPPANERLTVSCTVKKPGT